MTYITDIRHFLADDGFLVPGRAGRVGGYFARIAAAASLHPCGEVVLTAIRCTRRPGHKPCPGHIDLIRHQDGTIEWGCSNSDCEFNGMISGWEATLWDWRPMVPKKPPAEVIELVLSEEEFGAVNRCSDLSPDGQILVDGAVRGGSGGGIRIRGTREEFANLVEDLAEEAGWAPRLRRKVLKAVGERMGEVVGAMSQSRRPD